jgi:GntR family transcriptional regulator / MocR family aminotransferase
VAGTWAISGPDLHLDLTGTRRRAALESALRDAVRTARLRPGARLPSSRALAQDLGVARNTVADAYGQLVAEGWLVARQGSGTRVAARAPTAEPHTAADAVADTPRRFDLHAGAPDLSSFPRAAWLAAARRALNSAPDTALGYSDPRGRPELRQALSAYLARARGVDVTPERLVVCSGFTQALALLCDVLRARGARALAMEGHSLPAFRAIASTCGLRVTTLPVDEHGARVAELRDADAALLTPAHQFPLGASLAPARRTQAVGWAVDTGGLVIEDDYDGEFRYDRQPVGAMQALAPEHVVYAGTTSKTLAPGLRLGWLALPARLIDDVVAAKTLADGHTGVLDQLTLAEFIASGAYDRHVRRRRLANRRRRDRLIATLRRAAPGVRIAGIAAGLHALAILAGDESEAAVVARAARHGLAVEGLGVYRAAEHDHPPALVIGYGRPPAHAYTATIARLAAVLAD